MLTCETPSTPCHASKATYADKNVSIMYWQGPIVKAAAFPPNVRRDNSTCTTRPHNVFFCFFLVFVHCLYTLNCFRHLFAPLEMMTPHFGFHQVTQLSYYRTEIHSLHPNQTTGEMVNTPAMTSLDDYGGKGKGRVFLNSPHPELEPLRPEIYVGELRWVTRSAGRSPSAES